MSHGSRSIFSAGSASLPPCPAEARARGDRGALVGVVLLGPVHAPDRGVGRVLGHLDEAHERLAAPRSCAPRCSRAARSAPAVSAATTEQRRREQDHVARCAIDFSLMIAPSARAPRARRGRAPRGPAGSPCPTDAWQCTQRFSSLCAVALAASSCTRSPWQRRQFSWRIARVARRDPDRLGEVLERERLRVVPAVQPPSRAYLPDEIVRQVAVDAGGDGVVARLLPRVDWLRMMWQLAHAAGSLER